MNWVRGLLRFWIVGSLFWVIGVIWLFADQYNGDRLWYYSASADHFSRTFYELTEAPYFSRGETLTVESPNLSIVFVTDLPFKDKILIHSAAAQNKVDFALPSKANVGPLLDRATAERHSVLKTRIIEFAQYALLPPVLAFAIGAMVLWAMRGFRKN